ncbi:MAG: EAL domain-containing protein [Pseudomonadota bacterium]|nr:EAL domain-containing protein [Pseudomonadota bacterium]
MTDPRLLHDPAAPADQGLADVPAITAAAWCSIHASTSVESGAAILLSGLKGLGLAECTLVWSRDWPHSMEVLSHGGDPRPDATVVASFAVAAQRTGMTFPADVRILCDHGNSVAVLVASRDLPWPQGHPAAAWAQAAGTRLCELMRAERLKTSVAQLAHAEKLQRALFAIADMAGSDLDMPQMLQGLHGIVGSLMYAENFYIAMYERDSDTMRFLYFADSVDEIGPPDSEMPMAAFERCLTWYLIRDRRPLMGSMPHLLKQVSGPLRDMGTDCRDWLGVPMMRDGEACGAVVVQSYVEGVQYTDSEQSLLTFVAEHILNALERKRGQSELERLVDERTQQLAQTNVQLQQQVAERLRGEHLQATLYRIAGLANADESSEQFYRQVHLAVGELLNAENFYIALLSPDGQALEFPYWVDASEGPQPPRPLGRGLTEYVLRTGAPLLSDLTIDQQLVDAGEIDPIPASDATSLVWLGVPLLDSGRVIGLVAVQSYTPEITYGESDMELLTFVSYQIANSLQRRRSAEALRRLNAELEQRVVERTSELSEQIRVRERVEAQLKHQVMHDPLTGLPNRLYLRDRLDRALAGLRRNPLRRFALLYLDIDRFKLFNDSLGHLAGDEVLREVARRLGDCIREPDVVARLSGDEFALLLEDAPLPHTACKVAQRIQEALQEPMVIAGRELQTSASIGIAIGGEGHESIDQLLHDADVALYRAKSAGRQRFVLFEDSLEKSAMDVLEIERELRAALVKGEFRPYFQPLVRLDDASIVGYEALIRWQHPQRGLLLPGDFLGVAEDSGLIEAIDWQMYRMACEAGRALVRNGGFLTLNISPRHFQNADFDERLLRLAEEAGYPASQLRIEVTEGTLLGDPEAVARILERLRASCVEAALDDFGTGYSSFGYVQRFPLKMIKIDRSFVEPLGRASSQRSSAIVSAILALAQSLGLEVVAEGIETEAQRQALAAMGCVHAQGYLFGRPHPAEHWLQQESPAA